MLLFLLMLLTTPQCSVKVAPQIGQAPMRYLRVRVTIEPGARDAFLELVGPVGRETSSEVHTDRRTQQIEWKNVVLGPGEYDVILRTSVGCMARDRVVVVE